jgi:ribosome-binding protein aMBF1 (putative translation factor)
MSPEQIRAARSWLGWSQSKLAEQAHVGLSTVKDYESGKRMPIANNREAIQRALEASGIRFTDDAVSGPIRAAV